MTLEVAGQLLTTALLIIQSISANPALPQATQQAAEKVAQEAITRATRIIAQASVSGEGMPSCTITADKPNYYLGEVLVFTLKSTNAVKAEFVPDTSWKENIPVPTGELFWTSGTYYKVAPAAGYPFLTLKVTDEKGRTATCSKMVYVYELPRVEPAQ